MSVFAQSGEIAPSVKTDPRLEPTPDYGTLGPGSDFAKSSPGPAASVPTVTTGAPSGPRGAVPANLRVLRLLAMMAGIAAALLASNGAAAWKKLAGNFEPKRNARAPSAKFSDPKLELQRPQKQAEILLTEAVSKSDSANNEIRAHADSWRGRISWSPRLSDLTTLALNSNDENVRASGIEVQLAAYGLSKNTPTVEGLISQADSANHAQKIWALWSLGLLGNRGVESDRVVQVLTSHLKDSGSGSEDSRRWAVEGLALVGTSATIPPLLDSMHNDPSPLVRERAACSLAESGMLSHEQRLTAVPQLINYSDDPALDAQTHAWAFQALHDITKQPLPNDSAVWRNWYQNSVASGQ